MSKLDDLLAIDRKLNEHIDRRIFAVGELDRIRDFRNELWAAIEECQATAEFISKDDIAGGLIRNNPEDEVMKAAAKWFKQILRCGDSLN